MKTAFLSNGGALVTDHEIEGCTMPLNQHAEYYGATYMIAETMTVKTAEVICSALGLKLVSREEKSNG